jgi:hypothetical protein
MSAALDPSCCHRLGERGNEVRVVVAGAQGMRPEVYNLMPHRAELYCQFFLQTKPAMISCNSHSHICLTSNCC